MDINRSYKIAFIDLDGTLIDLDVDWIKLRENMRYFIKNKGLPLKYKMGIRAMIIMALKKRPEIISKLLKIQTRYEEKSILKSKLKKGAKDLLSFLSEREVKIYIISNNNQKVVEKAMQKNNLVYLVNKILGRRDTIDGARIMKPNASLVIKNLKKIGIKKSDAIIIGNDAVDINLANKAKISCLIISKNKMPNKSAIKLKNLSQTISYLKKYGKTSGK